MSFISIKKKNAEESEIPTANLDLEIPEDELRVSDEAATRIRELMSKELEKPQYLRVGIVGGGCSGLSYSYAFESTSRSNDLVFKNGDVEVCVDPKSMKFIGGSVLHWQESMKRMGFQIINKKSRKSCSCGESFSV